MFSFFNIKQEKTSKKKDFLLELSKGTTLIEKATIELEEVIEELRDSFHKDTNIILRVFRSIGDFFEKPIILIDNRGYPIYYNVFAKDIFYPNLLDNINIFSLIFGKNPSRQEINQNSNIHKKIKIQLSENNVLECKISYFSIISDHKINYLVFIEDEKESKLSTKLDNFHSINFLFRKIFSRNKRFAICAFFSTEKNFINFDNYKDFNNGYNEKENNWYNKENNEENEFYKAKQKLIYFNSTFIERFHHLIGNNFCFDKLFDITDGTKSNGISFSKLNTLTDIKKIINSRSYYRGIMDVVYLKNQNEENDDSYCKFFDYINNTNEKNETNKTNNVNVLNKQESLVIKSLSVYITSIKAKPNFFMKNSNIFYDNGNGNNENNEKLYFCVIDFDKDIKNNHHQDVFSIMISSGILSNWIYDKEKKTFSINLNDPIFSFNPLYFIALTKFTNCYNNFDTYFVDICEKLKKEVEQAILFFEDDSKIFIDIEVDLTKSDFLKKHNIMNIDEQIIFDEHQNKERFQEFIKIFDDQKINLITKKIRFVKTFHCKKFIKGMCFPIMPSLSSENKKLIKQNLISDNNK